MVMQDPKKSPKNSPSWKRTESSCFTTDIVDILSPRFRSVAAMAGWDEEALLVASLIVEDTPERDTKDKRRSDSSSWKRKRGAKRRNSDSIPVVVLNLEYDQGSDTDGSGSEEKNQEPPQKPDAKKVEENKVEENVPPQKPDAKKVEENVPPQKPDYHQCSSNVPVPCSCMERLREELSCAICLEICYEPSTTPCGHSFCKKCLRSAADKCGKRCPKCRQLISNIGRSCTINTVLWNTIQLLFPQEVEAKKSSGIGSSDDDHRDANNNNNNGHVRRSPDDATTLRSRRRQTRTQDSQVVVVDMGRIGLPTQDEDAALALRLQRQEFMGVVRRSAERNSSSSSALLARSNLRAMASRAVNLRVRRQPTQFL